MEGVDGLMLQGKMGGFCIYDVVMEQRRLLCK